MSEQGVALLVVDMQNEIVKGRLAKPENVERYAGVAQTIGDLLNSARSRRIPIVYTRVCFRPSYVDAHPHSPAIRVQALKTGEWSAEIVDELKPAPEDVIVDKRRSGAFYGTDLEIVLRNLEVRTLIVTGLATNRAVESTVREAHSRDLECVVVSDATAAGSEELHLNALRSIADWFGKVMSASEIVERFSGVAGPERS